MKLSISFPKNHVKTGFFVISAIVAAFLGAHFGALDFLAKEEKTHVKAEVVVPVSKPLFDVIKKVQLVEGERGRSNTYLIQHKVSKDCYFKSTHFMTKVPCDIDKV